MVLQLVAPTSYILALKPNGMSSNTNGPESRIRGAKNLPWKRNLRIGTLNVRTLAQSGSLESLKMDLKKYNLDVLGAQETRLEEQEIDLGKTQALPQ